ncbi:MAG: DUF1028 domain-containing protein [Actinomycetales bacterium]|nr:DUF1028 domain-containing protein [Actinomycetales bacterium]
MTFSIVARSEDGSELGVAVASKFLAVGAAVPAAEVGAGAVATQAMANLAYRPRGLALLAAGGDARDVLTTLLSQDEAHEHRQAGIVDARGGAATFTGEACFPWAGGTSGVTRAGSAYAIQGNILTGPEVVDSVEHAWRQADVARPFRHRLLDALLAGDRAGGDSRGRQSAALLVVRPGGGYGGGSDVLVDLRVDDHPDPVPELVRLLAIRDLLFERPDPADCLPLEGDVADEVRRRLAALGHTEFDVAAALEGWAGIENLEERMVPGRIDLLVLDHLRTLTGGAA